jgi:hypothetical protein
MPQRISMTVLPKGAWFERDPEKTFDANVEEMLAAIAEEGETELKAVLRSGAGSREPLSWSRKAGTGARVSGFVHGRVAGNVPWHRWAAISPFDKANDDRRAIATYAAAAEIQRTTHAFSTVASRLRRSRAAQLAELTRGLE